MDNQIKSLNDLPPYLFYNAKDNGKEEYEKAYIPVIFKSITTIDPSSKAVDPYFEGMYAMSYKNGLIDPFKFLFKVSGSSYKEVAEKLAKSFSLEPVKSRFAPDKFWKNKPGAEKQIGFNMDEHFRG